MKTKNLSSHKDGAEIESEGLSASAGKSDRDKSTALEALDILPNNRNQQALAEGGHGITLSICFEALPINMMPVVLF